MSALTICSTNTHVQYPCSPCKSHDRSDRTDTFLLFKPSTAACFFLMPLHHSLASLFTFTILLLNILEFINTSSVFVPIGAVWIISSGSLQSCLFEECPARRHTRHAQLSVGLLFQKTYCVSIIIVLLCETEYCMMGVLTPRAGKRTNTKL